MRTQYRVIALTLLFCLLLGTAGTAYGVTDMDLGIAYGLTDTDYDTAYGLTDTDYDTAYGLTDTDYDTAYGASDADYNTAYGVSDADYNTAYGVSDVDYGTAYVTSDADYSAAGTSGMDYGTTYNVTDADYSAALITVMGEGRQPQEELIPGMTEQQVQEVAISKQSYTTDVLTVRELPGTEYTELAKLAQYAKVNVIGVCDNGWSHVQLEDGTAGFVSNEYLSDLVPEGAKNIGESLGLFTVTYYCSCELCCGWWSGGPTASGVYPVADWTVAADPDVLPFGTRIYINGHEYCVEDTGSGVNGKHIDIYVTDHELAVNNGITSAEVFASKSEQ